MGTAEDYGDMIQRAVRAQLRAEIAARGLKQNEVAKRAGMHTSTLSRYLSDDEDRGLPYWAVGAIARALGLDPHVIAQRAERRLREDGGENEAAPGLDGPEPLGVV